MEQALELSNRKSDNWKLYIRKCVVREMYMAEKQMDRQVSNDLSVFCIDILVLRKLCKDILNEKT